MNIPKRYLTETTLVEKVHKVNIDQVLAILTQSKPANQDDPNYDYYKKLAWWAENNREQIKKKQGVNLSDQSTRVNAKLDISDRSLINNKKLEKHYGTIVGVLDQLWILMMNEGKFGQNAKMSELIQQTTLEILSGLSKMPIPKKNEEPEEEDPKDPEGEEEEEEEESSESEDDDENEEDEEDPISDPDPKSGKSRDWTAYKAEKLAKANGKPTSEILNEFYDEYYSVEYAGVESPEKDTNGIVAKLKSLDKILIPEFNKLGYNIEVNPFASFLKIVIKERFDEIFKKLTYNTYGAIHNSFIEKYITGNMLGQKFDETNILFCSDLYNKNGLDMIEYLSLQKQIINAQPNSAHANVENLVAKVFVQQNVDGENYAEKVDNLKKLPNAITPGNTKARLRSLLEIRELYRYLFGTEAEATRVKVDNKAVDEIIKRAENKNAILAMISHILDQGIYTESDSYSAEVRKHEAWFEKLNPTISKDKKKDCKQILSKYQLNAAAYNLIIKNLIHRYTEITGNKK
jgi:hypothetical protein